MTQRAKMRKEKCIKKKNVQERANTRREHTTWHPMQEACVYNSAKNGMVKSRKRTKIKVFL